MVWQPTSSGGPLPAEEVKCGVQRPSMKTNPLLSRSELGKVTKTTFSNPPPEHVFGLTNPPDAEGAREVTMIWKAHQPNPDDKPGPDFVAMNKLAAVSGQTTAKELPTFRQSNYVTLKKGENTLKPPPPVPSDKDPAYTYGMPSAYRTAEQVRSAGPEEPPMKYVVQGAYQHDWIRMNQTRSGQFVEGQHYIKPTGTKAALGHHIGALKHLQPEEQQELWKMSKFKKADPKVTLYMQPGAHHNISKAAPPDDIVTADTLTKPASSGEPAGQ